MAKQNNLLKPAEALYEKARGHLKAQEFDQARACLEESLKIERSARAFQDLGVLLCKDGKTMEGIAAFQSAAALDPAWHQPYANLYRVMTQLDNFSEALKYCAMAINITPTDKRYCEDFIRIAQNYHPASFEPLLKEAILNIFKNYEFNHQEIVQLWFAIVNMDPSFKPMREAFHAKNYEGFKEAFAVVTDTAAFFDPFLLAGMRYLLIPVPQFEIFAKNIRRAFLEEADTAFIEPPTDFIAALAEYCFLSEYVMSVTEDEQERVDDLKKKIEGGAADARHIAVYAAYEPLCNLGNARDIEKKFAGVFAGLIRTQITEPLRARELRGTIPTLTPIEDAVSIAVREQYEEFPYPRWRSLSKMYENEFVARREFGEAHSVLNAGCGTGRHMLSYAAHLPQTQTLAVDLSLSSLSYAKQHAESYGIKNVEFMQSDILSLGKLGRTFDMVECAGVLHHMRDPIEGWRVLRGLIRPRGLMRMALYSELARVEVVRTQKLIIERGYGFDMAGIRKFRDEAQDILPPATYAAFVGSQDYYSTSTCRDLLFHVQEMRFDIPLLKKTLDDLGLEFVHFCLELKVFERFNAEMPAGTAYHDLRAWETFEKKHPYIFQAMYQFWCRAKD